MFSHIRKLKLNETYTMASFTMSGIPYRLCFTLKSMRNISHGEYSDAYHLKYVKFKIGGGQGELTLHEGKQFIIWAGQTFPNINLDVSSYTKDYDGVGIKTYKRWSYANPRYMDRALKSVSQTPIVSYYRQIADVEELFDITYIID